MTVEKVIAGINIDRPEADLIAIALRAYVMRHVGCTCKDCKSGDLSLKNKLEKAMRMSYDLQKIGGLMYDSTEIDKHLKDWTKFEEIIKL